MPITILVVDDSGFFRRQIIKLLSEDSDLEVIGTAEDGLEAIEKALELKPDVITMDIEMPKMDGISATREITRQRNIPILMFSSLTTDGAQSTLDAMDAGAVDFIPKRFEDISRNPGDVRKLLCDKIHVIGTHGRRRLQPHVTENLSTVQPKNKINANKEVNFKILLIGTSTGGPLALQKVLTNLPEDFPIPILLVQHMPATFTPAFAKRLNQQCKISVSEAVNDEILNPGHAYLAPGGMQMELEKIGAQLKLKIFEGDPTLTYRPSVDVTFQSVANVLAKNTLAVMLTGMGSDGCEGAKRLSEGGSVIWAQNEASSVVWGMPSAVIDAHIVEKILPLDDISTQIIRTTIR